MAVIGELIVNLKASTAAFATDMKKATSLAFGSSKEIERSMKIIGTAAVGAAGAAAGALLLIAERTAAYGEEIQNAAQKTGMGAEQISALKFAAEQAEVPFEALQVALKKFSQGLTGFTENKAFDKALKSMGVDPTALRGLDDMHAKLLVVADAFSKHADGAGKAAVATAIFGKAGNDLIPLLNQGSEGIKNLEEQARLLGLTFTKEGAAAAAEFSDQLDMLKGAARGLEFTIGQAVIPRLNEMLTVAIALAQVGLPSLTQAARDAAGGLFYIAAWTNPALVGTLLWSKTLREELDKVVLTIAGGKKQTEDLTQKILGIRAALSAGTQAGAQQIDIPDKKTKTKEPFDWAHFDAYMEQFQKGANQLNTDIMTAELNELAEAQRAVDAAIRASAIPEMPEIVQHVSDAMKPLTPEFVKLGDAAQRWGAQMESAFTSLILHGADLKETLRGLILMLAEMALKTLVFKSIADSLSGGTGLFSSILGGFFKGLAGGRQMGGPVSAGSAYLVGERGPEVFVPNAGGQIVPNNKMGGGTIINIDARGADAGVEYKVMRALAAVEGRATKRAQIATHQMALRTA